MFDILDRVGVHREITLAILLPGALCAAFGILMLIVEETSGKVIGALALAIGLVYLAVTMLLWRRNSKLSRELDAEDEPNDRLAA